MTRDADLFSFFFQQNPGDHPIWISTGFQIDNKDALPGCPRRPRLRSLQYLTQFPYGYQVFVFHFPNHPLWATFYRSELDLHFNFHGLQDFWLPISGRPFLYPQSIRTFCASPRTALNLSNWCIGFPGVIYPLFRFHLAPSLLVDMPREERRWLKTTIGSIVFYLYPYLQEMSTKFSLTPLSVRCMV